MKPDYPGKPGPKPTGLKRDVMFPLGLDADEYEYARRKSKKQTGKSRQAGPWIRSRILPRNWRAELNNLRQEQGPTIP